MNDNKAARVLNRIFQICFFICMAVTFVGVFVYGYVKESRMVTGDDGVSRYVRTYYSTAAHWLIYLAAIVMLLLFCGMYRLSRRDYRLLSPSAKMSAEKKYRIILFGWSGFMLVVMLIVAALLKINPSTDLKVVDGFAASFAETGSFQSVRDLISSGENNYMARYPNNFGILMILSALYRVAYLVFGYIPRYLPAAVNACAIAVSLILTALIARQIWGRRRAVYLMLLLSLFAPFYAYTPFYYTDSLSMPFGMLGIYLYVLALNADPDRRVKKYALLVIAGAVIFIGFKVKGSLIVLIAAAVIYSLLKHRMKEFACVALALVLGFGSFFAAHKVAYKAIGLVTEEQADRYEYPYTHWLMMGLKGRGGYNDRDSQFTSSFDGKANKQAENIRMIKLRLKTYLENHKLTEHFIVKSSWMWGDGTYFVPGHIKDYVRRCFLHEFVLRDGKYHYLFYGYCNAYQLVLLLMMLFSLLKGIIRPKIDYTVFLKAIIFAIFVFLLLWEGRSRYLFNLTPVFIMVAADGIAFTVELTDKLKNKIKKKTASPEQIPAEAE